ncbi:hypothetical protein SDC9_188957 [bioreactor metagenome]|uniref:Uncharacterized protein n=1 Tax=bioreactor metagenome TaxID=1076179 RepID=A0A645HQS5_9ZZZZ|nr:hypothetical protein [Candidatus Pelethousia sp.]NCB30617.1 hypothetical protein [Clostridia bacterium]
MNYFGLFFTFMLPGILLGLLGAFSFREAAQERRRRAFAARRRAMRQAGRQAQRRRRALYISTMDDSLAA